MRRIPFRPIAHSHNKPKTQPRPDQSHPCDTRPIWTPWGWAMNRSLLTWLLANWCTGNPCFTCKIKARRRELFPVLSRLQNSGCDLGENNRSPELYRSNHRTPWGAGRIGANAFACPAPTGM